MQGMHRQPTSHRVDAGLRCRVAMQGSGMYRHARGHKLRHSDIGTMHGEGEIHVWRQGNACDKTAEDVQGDKVRCKGETATCTEGVQGDRFAERHMDAQGVQGIAVRH